MTRLSALLLCCSFEAHAPDVGSALGGDYCGRVAVAEYTVGANCLKLSDFGGETLFRLSDSQSCGGPPCVVLQPGETAFALVKTKPGPEAMWSVEPVACDELCCGEYLGEEQCW